MAKFTIQWCESKDGTSKAGKPYTITKMTLVDEKGDKFENVSTFDKVVNGGEIEGEVVKKGEYLNFESKKAVANAGYKERVMEQTMARKEGSIAKFQDNKDWSIMTSSTMRDAVLLAIAELNATPNANAGTLTSRIENWRNWLVSHWDIEPMDKAPF